MSKVKICTWIYIDGKGEESHYPQVGGSSSSEAFHMIYWRCVVVFFATSIRNNPNANHLLFTNASNIPTVIDNWLKLRQIKIVRIPLTYRVPDGYYKAWNNQFYIFDVLNFIGHSYADDEKFLILDSDCVWVQSVANVEKAVEQYGLLTMTSDNELDVDYKMNGLSRLDMKQLFEEIGGSAVTDVPQYYCGEFVGGTVSELKRVSTEIDRIWNASLNRHSEGLMKFNEEAHMLSFAYYNLRYAPKTANPFIRRIWTQLMGHNTVSGQDHNLSVWHLPWEKKYGIKRLYQKVMNPTSRFWQTPIGDRHVRYLGSQLGIPRRSLYKFIADSLVIANSKMRRA